MDEFTPLPSIPISCILWLLTAGKIANINIDRSLQDFGITQVSSSDPQQLVNYQFAAGFREQVLSTIENEAIALLAGEQLPFGQLGILDYICASSQSVASAMYNLSCYFRLVAFPNFALFYIEKDRKGFIRYDNQKRCSHQQSMYEQQSAEFTFSLIISRVRALTKTFVKPARICFRHTAPNYVNEYQRIFQAPIEFETIDNLLVFEADCLELRPENPDNRLHQILKRYADALVSNLPQLSGVAYKVVEELRRSLQAGEPTAESVAKRLFMSTRTLHRKLKKENTSFASLKDQLRSSLAQSMLKNPELTIAEIAYLLGFSQPSAFNRAFKRWLGTPPQSFRDCSLITGNLIVS